MQTVHFQSHSIFNRSLFVIPQSMKNESVYDASLWKMTNQMGTFKHFFFLYDLNQTINSHIWTNTHLCFSLKKPLIWRFETMKEPSELLKNVKSIIKDFYIFHKEGACYTSHIGLYAISDTFKCIKNACQHSVLTLFLRKWFYWLQALI